MRYQSLFISIIIVISLLIPVHGSNLTDAGEYPFPPESDFVKVSEDYIELEQNESLNLYVQFFEQDDTSTPMDISSTSVNFTIWQVITNTSTLIEKRTISMHDEKYNSSSYKLYRDSFFGLDPGTIDIHIEMNTDTFSADKYITLNLTETYVEPPNIRILNIDPDITYGPNDPIEFVINSTTTIRSFSVLLDDIALVTFNGPLSDGQTSTMEVRDNGSFLHFKKFDLGKYEAFNKTGDATITIQAENQYYASATINEQIKIDGEGPITQIITKPDEGSEFGEYVYYLPENGQVQIELSSTDPSGISHYRVVVGDRKFETNSSTITIEDDGNFEATYTGFRIYAIDTLGNEKRAIVGSIKYIQNTDTANGVLSLPVIVIPLVLIVTVRIIRTKASSREHDDHSITS